MTDTQAPTLPAEPSPDGPTEFRVESEREAAERAGLWLGPRSHRWWSTTLVVVSGIFLMAVLVAATLPSKWFAEAENVRLGVEQPAPYARVPASAQPVDERVVVGDLGDLAEQFPPVGDIFFVTVMHPSQTLLSWLVGRDNPAIQFLTEEDVFGFQTPIQRRTLDLASMRTSEQVAEYVAMKRIGFDVSIVPGDVLIEDIVCLKPNADGSECEQFSPSGDVLQPGDKIIAVDGDTIDTVEDLSRVLEGRKPGDEVTMTIVRPDEGQVDVTVELTASPDDPDRTIVGFYPFDTATVDLPFELSIDTASIGGPSAGLAFTLTLIDELTEGELTGGGDVAVTGTIQLDGTVGPIGGLRQKASAVSQAGVKVFIVPAAQGEKDIAAAQESAGPGVKIIPVENLDQALAALESAGGDPLPPTATTPTTTSP